MNYLFSPMKWSEIVDVCNNRDLEALRLRELIKSNVEKANLLQKAVSGRLFRNKEYKA